MSNSPRLVAILSLFLFLTLPAFSVAPEATSLPAVPSSAGVAPAPATINVPGDYATIQAAIDAAVSGDTVNVAPGTYNEVIDFGGKAIHLRSVAGATVTIIDGTGFGTSTVSCVSGEGPDTILEGFTITGGTGTEIVDGGFVLTLGGGMYNFNSSPTVRGCRFTGNSGFFGGGIEFEHSDSTLINCVFDNNEARFGGGVEIFPGFGEGDSSSVTVINCSFSANVALGNAPGIQEGGGISHSNFFGKPNDTTIINCVFWGNSALLAPEISAAFASSVTVSNTVVRGSGGSGVGWDAVNLGIDAGGNIDADPLFANSAAGNFRLQFASPAIDAGDNAAVAGIPLDADSNARVVGAAVDMGAYEFAPDTDTDGDGLTDTIDPEPLTPALNNGDLAAGAQSLSDFIQNLGPSLFNGFGRGLEERVRFLLAHVTHVAAQAIEVGANRAAKILLSLVQSSIDSPFAPAMLDSREKDAVRAAISALLAVL